MRAEWKRMRAELERSLKRESQRGTLLVLFSKCEYAAVQNSRHEESAIGNQTTTIRIVSSTSHDQSSVPSIILQSVDFKALRSPLQLANNILGTQILRVRIIRVAQMRLVNSIAVRSVADTIALDITVRQPISLRNEKERTHIFAHI